MIVSDPPPQLTLAELLWRIFWSLLVLVIETYFFVYTASILGRIVTAAVALLAAGFLGRDLYYRQRG